MNEYNYLGIVFYYNAKFNVAKQNLAMFARAMFTLLDNNNTLSLPVDVAVKLFTHFVKPVILYSSEVWGDGKCDILDYNLDSVNIFWLLMRPSVQIWCMENCESHC